MAIRSVDIDRYERIVGRIYVDDLGVSAEMVHLGDAWVYPKYAKDQRLYELEDEAKEDNRRLWGLQEAARIPPCE